MQALTKEGNSIGAQVTVVANRFPWDWVSRFLIVSMRIWPIA